MSLKEKSEVYNEDCTCILDENLAGKGTMQDVEVSERVTISSSGCQLDRFFSSDIATKN